MTGGKSIIQTRGERLALNAVAAVEHEALSPVALNVEGGVAPEWIELIPRGPDVVGHDGRRWSMPDAKAVISTTQAVNRPMAIDWEHSSIVRGDQGLEAPAAAWIEELDDRGGAVWGRVSWTPRAKDQVANREYRFISPTFTFDGATGRIKRLTGAGLTNNPNLHLTALNRAERHQESTLDLVKLREALGLPADAGDDAILAKAREQTAACKAGPDLTSYAPRTELTEAVNRANGLQTELNARKVAEHEAAVAAALDAAQTEGKITPASRDHYEAMCKAEGGLERFKSLAATLPVIVSGAPVVKGGKPETATDPASGLTPEELATCKAFGTDPVEFARAKKGDFSKPKKEER